MASAESRKRRTRHEIWDAEAQIEALRAQVLQLEEANQRVRMEQSILQQAISARDAQLEVLKAHAHVLGTPQPTSSGSASHQSLLQRLGSSQATKVSYTQSTGCMPASSASTPCDLNLLPTSPSHDMLSCLSGPSSDCNNHCPAQGTACSSPMGDFVDFFSTDDCSDLLGLLTEVSSPSPLGMQQRSCSHAPPPQGPASLACSSVVPTIILPGNNPVVDQDAARAVYMNETQLINAFKQMSEQLSPLLFCAEDASSPHAAVAAAQLIQAVNELLTTGTVAKVCNPAILRIVSQPVNPGLDPADDTHWEAVARALLLSPQQQQHFMALNQQRHKWLTKLHKDHTAVAAALQEVVQLEAHSSGRLANVSAGLRKAELMEKLRRVAGAGRWLLLLVDHLLLQHILNPLQVARVMVHSYPYVPDACAIVEAVERLHTSQVASTTRASMAAARKPASRGRKRVLPIPPPPASRPVVMAQ